MQSRIVTTKEELQKAYDEKVDEIIVKGKLAKKIKKTQKLKYVAPATIAGLGAAIAALSAGVAAAPATGGLSFLASGGAVAAISAQTGLSAGAVIVVASIGITLLVAIFKDYDLIELKNGDSSIRLERKK